MTKKTKDFGYLFIIALLLVAGFLSWNLYFKIYRQEDTVDIKKFPTKIEGWDSEDLPLTEDEMAILETDNVFVRRYFNPEGDEVFLFIVYSQNNRKVSHPPEICYTGAGAVILENRHDSIQTALNDIKTNRVTVKYGGTNQIFFYWFKVGDAFISNYWRQQGMIALKSFLGQPASSALIRISATVKNNDEQRAIEQIKDFGEVMAPHLKTYLP